MRAEAAPSSDDHTVAGPARPLPADPVPQGAGPPRRSVLGQAPRTLALLAAGTVVALVCTTVVQLAARRLTLAPPTVSATRSAVVVAALVMVFVPLAASVLLVRTPRWRPLGTVLSWAALSTLVSVVLAVPLGGSRLYLNGVSVDQDFRTQLLTRLTDSPALSGSSHEDMSYADLPSYYPTGWFWVGGRLADVLGLAGWQTYQPLAIGTLAIGAVVAAVLWTRLLRPDHAVVVASTSALVAIPVGAPEPYAAVLAMVAPPVLVITWTGLRAGGGVRRWLPSMVATGLFLGVTAMFYTLYLGLWTLVAVAMAALAAALAGRHRARTGVGPTAPGVLLRLVPVALVSGVLALVVWAPYLWRVAQGGPSSGAAQHYLPPSGASLMLPMTVPSLLGLLCLIGTGWLVLRASTSPVAQALGIGVLCVYLWSVLSLLAVFAQTTLLSFRLQAPLEVLLACAGALGVLEGARAVAAQLRTHRPDLVRPAGATLVVLALVGAFGLAQAIPSTLSTEVARAYTDPTADGSRADGGPAGDAAFYPQLDAVIRDQTQQPPGDVVVLSTDYRWLSFYPYRGFQMVSPHYANPLADFPARAEQVQGWAAATGPADLLRQLDTSPWPAPRAFVLRDDGAGYSVQLSADAYPENPNVRFYTVVLPKALFDDPAFTTTRVGPFAVVVRTG